MAANARFCVACGAKRRVGGPADGEEVSPGGIIVVSTGGSNPVSHALTDPTEEVVVIDDEGRAALEVRPAGEPLVVDLTEETAGDPAPSSPPSSVFTPPAQPEVEAQRTKRAPTGLLSPAALMGVGVVVVLAVVAAVVLLWPDGGPGVDVNAELVAGADTAEESLTTFSQAELLEDLSAAAVQAETAAATYDARVETLAEVGDEEVRAAAVDLLAAEQALVAAYGATFAEYTTRDLRRWDRRQEVLERRLDQVEEAQAALVSLQQDDLTARIDVDRLADQLTTLDRLLDDKLETFQEWVQERNAALGSQAAASFGLQGYAAPMRGLIDQYEGLREELGDWTAELDRRIVFVSEALTVLSNATTARRSIGNEMRTLQPPPALAAAHASIVGILDEAASALESAYEGIIVYVNDPFYAYTDVRQTPGWTTFQVASDRISASLDSAITTWESARAAEQQRINASLVPDRPEL